jgi:hypothetical protein
VRASAGQVRSLRAGKRTLDTVVAHPFFLMGWEGPFSRPSVVLLCALVLLPAQLAAGQMVTPLQGQGQPGNATREVFMSVYLDRLLGVDDINYRRAGTLRD